MSEGQQLLINTDGSLGALGQESTSGATKKSSTVSAFTNTLLSFFGIGLLTMPYGTRFVGMIGGPLLIALVASITCYCFLLVVKTKNLYVARGRSDVDSLNALGSESFGRTGTWLVNFAICANQIGTIAAYLQFIGQNLLHLIPSNLPLSFWVMVWCGVVIPLCCVREMKYFGFTSFFGISAVVFSVVSVIVYGFLNGGGPPNPMPLGPSDMFLFLGIAAFGYAGIAVSINVETSMQTPRHFPVMISFVFVFTTLIYIAFAVGAYWLYGDSLQAVISCSLGGVLGLCVRAALVLQLTFATPLNAHPLWSTIEPFYSFARPPSAKTWWIVSFIRAVIILVIAVVAFAVPYFGSFSNFIGAVAVSLTTWILPPMFHLKAAGKTIGLGNYLMNVMCIAFGVSVGISTATITVIKLISQIESPPVLSTC